MRHLPSSENRFGLHNMHCDSDEPLHEVHDEWQSAQLKRNKCKWHFNYPIPIRIGSGANLKREAFFCFDFFILNLNDNRVIAEHLRELSTTRVVFEFIYSYTVFLASWTILDDINKSFTYRFAFLEESKRLLKSTSVSGHEKICCCAYVCGSRRSQHSVNIPPSITEYKKRASQLKAHTHTRETIEKSFQWMAE